jgi:hypothetical protein
MIDDEEHDRYEWVSIENALSRCRPAAVAEGIVLAMEACDEAREHPVL